MAGYNGAGSLFALGSRLTLLNDDGTLQQGSETSYVSDNMIKADIGLEYEDGDEITVKNGAGVVCLSYKAPDTLKRGTITGFQFCAPDPYLLKWLIGARVILDDDNNAIGAGAPEVGTDPTPNGVSVELWTRAIIQGAYAGYFWWALPRCFFRMDGNLTASGTDGMIPEFTGFCTQNPNWLDGPANDWLWPSDRVWQFVQTATLPDLTRGFRVVGPELTVTSIEVTPPTADLDVSDDTTQQLVVTATMSDASTRVVTSAASYVSDAPAIAAVDADGLVSPVSAGNANVTATYGGQTDVCAVTVTV